MDQEQERRHEAAVEAAVEATLDLVNLVGERRLVRMAAELAVLRAARRRRLRRLLVSSLLTVLAVALVVEATLQAGNGQRVFALLLVFLVVAVLTTVLALSFKGVGR